MISALQLLNEPKVHEIRSLGWHDDHVVKGLLTNVAKQVQPVLKKRGWVVPLLCEMYPDNPRLLGLNVGGGGGRTSEIRLRVRKPQDKKQLLSMESLLGTMLHELVHNVQGPHDKVFYQLLDELHAELEALAEKGITRTGAQQSFHGLGHRLGAHAHQPEHNNPPPHQLRSLAVQAAEARAKRARLMPAGPHKLGTAAALPNANAWHHMAPAQAAAAAAERRAVDDIWCPCEARAIAGHSARQLAASSSHADAQGIMAPSFSSRDTQEAARQRRDEQSGMHWKAAIPAPATAAALTPRHAEHAHGSVTVAVHCNGLSVASKSKQGQHVLQPQPGPSTDMHLQCAPAHGGTPRTVIDLTLEQSDKEDSYDDQGVCITSAAEATHGGAAAAQRDQPQSNVTAVVAKQQGTASDDYNRDMKPWICQVCTFRNTAVHGLVCTMCLSVRRLA